MSENRWIRIYEQRAKNIVGLLRVCQATHDYSKLNIIELVRIIETAVEEIHFLQDIIKKLKNAEVDVLDNLCGDFLNYVIGKELNESIEQFDEFLKENKNGNDNKECMVRDTWKKS